MINYNQVIHVNWLDKRTTKVLILQAVLLLQMQLRPVAHFWVVATAKQQQSNSKPTQKWVKKTGQSCIWKRSINNRWVLRVQWTLGTCFCVLWHTTHVYVVRNPCQRTLSIHFCAKWTTDDWKSSKNKIFFFQNYHKLYICLLLISTWYVSLFCTF